MNTIALVSLGALAMFVATAVAATPYEVWAIDQSSSSGKSFGGTMYVYDGRDLERGHRAAEAIPEVIDLSLDAAALCLERTGVNPARPHMIAMNAGQSHAIVSFVATGHVLIMDAPTRSPIECIHTSVGAGGARQMHFAIPSPDESCIAVANQNGKLFERIDTDFATIFFMLNTGAMIDLVSYLTPNGVACQDPTIRPDNALICPIVESTSH